VERPLVGSRSLLFDRLRSSLRAGALRRQRASLAHRPCSPQSAKLSAFADSVRWCSRLLQWIGRGKFNRMSGVRQAPLIVI